MGRAVLGRGVVVALVVLALVAGAALIGWDVLRPRETLTRPTVPYPAAAVMITDERPFSELRAAPLVVEGRLRVYAEKRRVWADFPVGGRYEATPYWAFRRWPQQLVGVVTVTSAAGPYVITQWTDGELVAIDARRGEVAWRTAAPSGSEDAYAGRRTGASVVYEPRSLLTGRSGTEPVVLVTSAGAVHAYDGATGRALWQHSTPGGCEPLAWTGDGLLALPDCAGSGITFLGLADGTGHGTFAAPAHPTPQLCALGRSECRLVTAAGSAWLLHPDATVARVPPLEPGAVLAGDRVVYPTASGLAARRLTDGAPLWTWTGKGRLVAADSVGVYVLTTDRTVLGLSPVTGRLAVLGCASAQPNEDWLIGHVYTTDTDYLALERVTHAPPSSKDGVYFYGPRPVALVELYPPNKLPVWSGKFAACAPQPAAN